MNNVVWRYPINTQGITELALPGGAQALSVNTLNERLYLWVLVDPDKHRTTRRFRLVVAGESFEASNPRYIGTSSIENGRVVFHLFEV